MASKTEIFNHAATLLGKETIGNPDTDDSPAAIAFRSVYDLYRDAVVQLADWSFARRRKRLTAMEVAPDFGWSQQYQLNTNMLVIRELRTVANARLTDDQWDKEGNDTGPVLVTNTGPAILMLATYRVTNETLFSPMFAICLGAFMAWNTARGLIGNDENRIQEAKAKFQDTLTLARDVNGRDRPLTKYEYDEYTEVRQ